jgi:hypothetical protein
MALIAHQEGREMIRLLYIVATISTLTVRADAADCVFYKEGNPMNDHCILETQPNNTCKYQYTNPDILAVCQGGTGLMCTFSLPTTPGFSTLGKSFGPNVNIVLSYKENSSSPVLSVDCE